jgi:hypothetical protein
MAGIGKYKKGAKFTLKSGNSPVFKMVGSSPIMHYVDDVPDHNDGHPDDLQSPEEHETWRKENEKPSPTKQTDTTYTDRTKKSKREQDFAERYTTEKVKDKYWYKINNKSATKAQYMAYENKPGGDEPGKQTNDPNVSLAKQSANKRKQK